MKRIKIIITVMSVFLLPISNTIQAKTLNLKHKIDKVTVYSHNAMVTRTATVSLTAGDHVLIMNNLPASIKQNSLRVSGLGSAKVLIGSIEKRTVPSDTLVQGTEKEIVDKMTILDDQVSMLKNDIQSLNLRLAFIKSLGKNIPDTLNKEIKVGTLKPKMWQEAWETIGDGASKTYQNILVKNQLQRKILVKLNTLRIELNKIRTDSRTITQAHVNISVQQAGEFTLNLSYQIYGATWKPVYDARLNVTEKKLLITQYGHVRQRTGEDWNDVKITLSTSNPTQGVAMPDLQPWFIRAQAPIRHRAKSYGVTIDSSSSGLELQTPSGQPESIESFSADTAEFEYADQVVSEFAAEFHINGRSNVKADNSAQKFTISEHKLSTILAARVVPKKESKAYLYAETTYTGLASLLAGEVSLFRDNTYVGNLHIDLVRPSEKIKLSFGVDERIKVNYRLVTDDRAIKGFLSDDNVINRLYQIDIVNHHKKPFTIELLEQIPVSQDEQIQIELTEKTTPPTEKNIDSRLGVMAWKYLYQPNDKKKIIIGYQVRYPKNLNLLGL